MRQTSSVSSNVSLPHGAAPLCNSEGSFLLPQDGGRFHRLPSGPGRGCTGLSRCLHVTLAGYHAGGGRRVQRYSVAVRDVSPGDDLCLLPSDWDQRETSRLDWCIHLSHHRELVQNCFGNSLGLLLWPNNACSLFSSFYGHVYLSPITRDASMVRRNGAAKISQSTASKR